ncbi:outer membrane beta-barrel protein [Telluria aromaticivorans]|uniref:Outer membrane beta-barrel protein n=1 Tax=Telluria aromaticivorans TaxID=2725995 RepID=A0A7Y2JVC5_9BURK|nr:outer membrane beta-barrel protein [Telluria aromaticivorans]NNG21591.1 outer membrane beta-barrel protein [Telluria aromaticivorans]
MFKKIAAAAALVIASSSAFAAQPQTFYAGVDAGATELDDVSGNGTSVGAFVGYTFVQNLAIEASYRRLGRLNFREFGYSGKVDLDQAAVSVVGTLPLGGNFSLLGRLGYNHIEADAKVNGFSGSESTSGALVGLGVAYAFTPAVSARLELQKPASDTTNLSVGVAFQF